tara:strand:- start:169 stop:345 length:177 start_codon:yes stop_codon:yes gene_type:complete
MRLYRGPKKPKIAPKWGLEPIFSPPRLDLEQACMGERLPPRTEENFTPKAYLHTSFDV